MKLSVNCAQLKSAMLCKANNDARFYLCGVLFALNGDLVGTNGHVAFIGQHDSKIENDVIISFQCQIPSKFSIAEIDITNGNEEGIVKFYDTLVNTKLIASGLVSIINGKYPDYTRVCKKDKKQTDEIGFNGQYLSILGKVSKLFNPGFSRVSLSLNGENGSAFSEIKNPYNEKAMLVIMPMRL